jgi:hypothetical protein
VPITPATTGPELMPMLSSTPAWAASGEAATASRMSSARRAARRAWSELGSGTPAAAM